jgi:hypothetical protein
MKSTTKLINRVLDGDDPSTVLTESAWMVYSAEVEDDQAEHSPVHSLEIVGVSGGSMVVRVNGERFAFIPKEGTTTEDLLSGVTSMLLVDQGEALAWLQQHAEEKASSDVNEATTTASGAVVLPKPMGTVRLQHYRTCEDNDGHTHLCILDEKGDGITTESDGDIHPHSHLVDRFKVRDYGNDQGFRSSHIGDLTKTNI